MASSAAGLEARLAERDVDVAVAVGAVLDLATLELADRAADVGGDGTGLRVGHQAAGAEGPAESADEGHHVGRGDRDVEVELAGLDLGGEVVGTDEVGSGIAGLLGSLTGGEHGDSNVFAGTGRQGDGAAHHLVGLTRVDAEADGDIDRLVELAFRHVLDDPQRFGRACRTGDGRTFDASMSFFPDIAVSLGGCARQARSSGTWQ